jgi:hypothetical protein
MRVVPSEKKKVQLIPEAIICHIDESTLFETTVSVLIQPFLSKRETNQLPRMDLPKNWLKT